MKNSVYETFFIGYGKFFPIKMPQAIYAFLIYSPALYHVSHLFILFIFYCLVDCYLKNIAQYFKNTSTYYKLQKSIEI